MAWEAPKTNWITGDAVGPSDFNRAENNTGDLRDVLTGHVKGLDITVATQDATSFTISPGSCMVDVSGELHPVYLSTTISKTLGAWALGSGNGSKASGSAALAAGNWWYVFLIYNPSSGSIDIQIDDNTLGANISEPLYYKKLISTFQLNSATGMRLIVSEDEVFYVGYDIGTSPTVGAQPTRLTISTSAPYPVSTLVPFQDEVNGYYMIPFIDVEVFGALEWLHGGSGQGIASIITERYGSGVPYSNNIISYAVGITPANQAFSSQYREFIPGGSRKIGVYIVEYSGYTLGYITVGFNVNGFRWKR